MILVLDDHPLVQQGICSLIQKHKPSEEIVCASTVKESIVTLEQNQVEMVFVDVNLGKENGLSLLAWVKENDVPAKVFVITSSSRQSDFRRAQELGVDAYVLKDAFLDDIVYGLQVVERGDKFYSATLVEQMSKDLQKRAAFATLTKREMEVFLLLAQGDSNAQISETLFISEGTTKKHISSILAKLNLQSRVEAALLASQANLTKVRSESPKSEKEGVV